MMFSKGCQNYIKWSRLKRTDGKLDPDALAQIRDICTKNSVHMVVPADLDATLLLAECPRDNAIPKSALPSPDTITNLNNKWTLSKLLEKLDLPYPQSEHVQSDEELLATKLKFPIITKPLDKWNGVGFEIHRTRAALEQTIASKLKSGYPLIAQRYIPGWDAGASFLADKGRLVAYSIFRTLKRGERIFYDDNRVREYLEKFVAATGYSGVGLSTRDTIPNRMNTGYWSSIPDSGARFSMRRMPV
jgi:predicted ATP-grasp superfamily ATP-dependent carboligase